MFQRRGFEFYASTAIKMLYCLRLMIVVPVMAFAQTMHSSSSQVQRVFVTSAELRMLLSEVKSYGYVDIPINQDLSATSMASGFSEVRKTPQGKVYQIHVSVGPDTQVKNLIAHELFHGFLLQEGFSAGSGTIVRGQELRASNEFGVMEDMLLSLTNCYQDAIIDRRMAILNFEPQLLQDEEKASSIAQANLIPHTTLYRKDVALAMYCLSIRLRNFQMGEICAVYQSWYPGLTKRVQEITDAVGANLCKTGKECFKKMLALRTAVNLKGEITLRNPSTNQEE